MNLTEEQKLVLNDLLVDNKCVIATAVPGAGKTSLAKEIAMRAPDKKILVITYNKILEVGLTTSVAEAGIENLRASTIHGLLARQSGEQCSDDTELAKILDSECDLDPIDAHIVVIDEAQDLRPSLTAAIVFMLKKRTHDVISIMICGDPHQMLYDYASLGEDRANIQFMRNAKDYFGFAAGDKEWVERKLTISFRLTPNMATFLNAIWCRTDPIVGGNDRVPNKPVSYVFDNSYGKELSESVEDAVEGYGIKNVLVVGHSCKNGTPIVSLTNGLRVPAYLKMGGGGNSDEDQLRHKVHVLTACASKGAQYKCVFFIGFDVHAPDRMISINQLCVGLSRACAELTVVHHHKSHIYPIGGDLARSDETYELIKDLHAKGVLRCRYTPTKPKDPLVARGITHVSVSDCMRINAREISLISKGMCNSKQVSQIAVDNSKLNYFVSRAFKGIQYDVSDIVGEAIPFAFQASRGVPPPLVMKQIMSARIPSRNKTYSYKGLLSAAKIDNFTVGAVQEWEGFIDSNEMHLAVAGKLHRGAYTIAPEERNCFASAIFLKQWRATCVESTGLKSGERTSSVWLYLAAACRARSGGLNRFRHMGINRSSYEWDGDGLFKEAMRVMQACVPDSASGVFERELSYAPRERLPIKGVADWLDSERAILFEFKFCSCLSEEHRFQTCVYTAMLALEIGATATGVLLNVRTGAKESFVVEQPAALRYMDKLSQIMSHA